MMGYADSVCDHQTDGFLVGRQFRMAEYIAAKEEREYQKLFHELELRNKTGERKHRLPVGPLMATPKDPQRFAKAKKARVAADKKRHRQANPLEPRECRHCGSVFTPRHRSRMYCAERCKVRAAVARNAGRV